MVRPYTSMEAENRAAFIVQLNAHLTQIDSIVKPLTGANKTKLADLCSSLKEWKTAVGGAANTPRPSILTPTDGGTPVARERREETGETPPSTLGQQSEGRREEGSENLEPEGSGPTVEGDEVSSTEFGSKNINDLVAFIKLLFVSGIPESHKLQATGKGLVRLTTVRCFSTLTAALQHVTFLTYGPEVEREKLVDTFTVLSKDIRRSATSLTSIMRLVTFYADVMDVTRCRYGVQICVDVLRQTRRSMVFFQNRVEKEEASALRSQSSQDSDYPFTRAEYLRGLWGPSLADSIENVGDCIPVAIQYLIQVSAIDEKNTTPELVAIKKDVKNDLYSLSDFSTKAVTGISSPTSKGNEETDGTSSNANSAAEARATAKTILFHLHVSYIAEYLSSVVQYCGDENDGSITAASVTSDCLQHLARSGSGCLPKIMAGAWKKKILAGVLNCLLSPHPVVLGSGLQNLTIIVTTCIDVIGEEVGYLYSDCLYRLLESENCLLYIKREIVFHLLYTFLRPSNVPSSDELTVPPPLLLRLYSCYDLNVNSHHLNLAQQFISVLSRIVRRAPLTEFVAAVEEGSTESKKEPAGLEEVLQKKSLPYIALYGLVTAIELVGQQIPLEEDVKEDSLQSVVNITLRETKLERQRMVDVINNSPKKGIVKLFQITEEMMDPPDVDERFKKEFDHNFLPAPKTKEVKKKVKDVCSFLMDNSSLSPEAVSEFITMPNVFPLQVCAEYMSRLNLAGRSVVTALKELLSSVQLPKEGQRIERLLEYFSFAYYKANNCPGIDRTVFPFENEDTCFVIVVATVMLNTDLHNPVVASRMTQTMFCSQLKGCDKNVTTSFSDSIFESISETPLSNISGRSGGSLVNAAEAHSGLDAFFISQEERRLIAFGMERQRLATETRQLLCLRSCPPHVPEKNDWTWWSGVAKDFFLSSWASLCAVFGPSMCEDSSTPTVVLQMSIRGLKAVLTIAASFALTTECEIAMRSLLYMVKYKKVADACHLAILEVAATAYSIHFSAPCWLTVLQLIVSLQNDGSKNTILESVFLRIEYYTRARCDTDSEACKGLNRNHLKGAVRSILEGVVEVIRGCQKSGVNLSTAFALLRRCLGYSVLLHANTGSDVTNCVNTKDFCDVVLPNLVSIVNEFRESDESLKTVVENVVDILAVMWTSGGIGVRSYVENGEGPAQKTTDKNLLCFVQSCEFFKMCYTANSESKSPSKLVKMHLLQGIKELMTRSLLAVDAALNAIQAMSTDTIISCWRRILHPLVRALSDKENAATEISGLAVMVLRHLVVVTCGNGSNGAKLIPTKVRLVALLLLSNVCYIGAMCSDLESAQTCQGQLPTLCSAALNLESTTAVDRKEAAAPKFNNTGNLVLFMLYCIENEPQFVAKHILERLCLLLRNEHEQVRAETCESLRSLSLQLQPGHIQFLAVLLSDIVLEGAVGWVTPHNEIPMSDPTLIAFWVFLTSVPSTMKRCSRSSFRTVLPSVFGFMTDEMLNAAPIAGTSVPAELVIEHCLVPVMVSPNCKGLHIRSLAARSLSNCALTCLKRYSPGSNRYPLQTLLNGIGLVLYSMQLNTDTIIPAGTEFIGKEMTEVAKEDESPESVAYQTACKQSIALLATLNPPEISGRESFSSSLLSEESPKPTASPNPKTVTLARDATTIVKDEELVEHCNILAQLLSGLPKVLSTVNPSARGEDAENKVNTTWSVPEVHRGVIVSLLLSVLRVHFSILWRTTHPQEMQQFLSSQSSGDVSSVNNALMPHAAVRGALNSYIELAVQAKDYPFSRLLAVTVGLLLTVGKVQKQVLSSEGSSGRVANTPEQLFSPQEHQHIKTCNAGMYQELSVVLGHWLKTLQQPPPYANLSEERRRELQGMALDSRLFEAFVNLLTPTAGPLIVAAKDYFSWYIQQKKLSDSDIPPTPLEEAEKNNPDVFLKEPNVTVSTNQ